MPDAGELRDKLARNVHDHLKNTDCSHIEVLEDYENEINFLSQLTGNSEVVVFAYLMDDLAAMDD